MTGTAPLNGLVLAGGESRRMGKDKAGLLNDGRTQLETVYDLVSGVTDRTFVSTRPDQGGDALRAKFPQIVDRYDGLGPLAGILSALEAYPDADWLIVACDLPKISKVTLAELLRQAPRDAALVAYRSAVDGLPEPLCALYRSASAEMIRSYADDGVTCPRKIMLRADAHLLDLPEGDALDNINTPEDLARSVLEMQ